MADDADLAADLAERERAALVRRHLARPGGPGLPPSPPPTQPTREPQE